MAGDLEPLDQYRKIVKDDGSPTEYFIRWAQTRQIDIGEAITLQGLEAFLADHPLVAGSGITLTPSGNIAEGVTIAAEVQAILDQLSTTQGSVLYRGAADWAALAPGTSGQVLRSNGAGANPSWATASGTGLIQKQLLASPAASITFSAIPGTYDSLQLILDCTGTAAGSPTLSVRFNGDTGANYNWQLLTGFDTTVQASASATATSMVIGSVAGSSSLFPAMLKMLIPNYINTAKYKGATGTSYVNHTTAIGDGRSRTFGGTWRNTGALTSLDFILSSGNFATGSVISLYGI